METHRSADSFKARGGKMGEYMDGRAEMLRVQEVV